MIKCPRVDSKKVARNRARLLLRLIDLVALEIVKEPQGVILEGVGGASAVEAQTVVKTIKMMMTNDSPRIVVETKSQNPNLGFQTMKMTKLPTVLMKEGTRTHLTV